MAEFAQTETGDDDQARLAATVPALANTMYERLHEDARLSGIPASELLDTMARDADETGVYAATDSPPPPMR